MGSKGQSINIQDLIRQETSPWMKVIHNVVKVANIVAAVAMGVDATIRLYSYVQNVGGRMKKRSMGFTTTAAHKKSVKTVAGGPRPPKKYWCPDCLCVVDERLTLGTKEQRICNKCKSDLEEIYET